MKTRSYNYSKGWQKDLYILGKDFGIPIHNIIDIIDFTKCRFGDSDEKENYILQDLKENPNTIIEKNNKYMELLSYISSSNDNKKIKEAKEKINKLLSELKEYKNITAYNIGHKKLKKLIYEMLDN